VKLKFRPGQAVQVQIPGDEKKRFFSVSSAPTEGHFVEITIKAPTDTPLGQGLSTLKRGDPIEVEGPFGNSLTLPEPIPETVCFIAAGTGVTPFRSMIKSLLDTDAGTELWLLHSVKTRGELIFQPEFSEWSGSNARFHYVPTLTKDFDDDWKNETGRINEILVRKHIPEKPVTFMLCGPPAFVGDMERMLKEALQVQPANIRREQW
jgi:ferredoxin-NADP reductase